MESKITRGDRICLINMPFASPEAPSIALTQLKAVLERRLGRGVSVEVHYLDLDFLSYSGGLSNYLRMTSGLGRLAGAADWFFREMAFPEAPDNTEEYFARFYFDDDEETRISKEFLLSHRPGLEAFLDGLIDAYRLADARIVGFTSLFFQTMASFAMARRIKLRNPDVVTVMGGAACEAEMGLEYVRLVDQIDHVFSGPALVSFPEFAERQLAGDVVGCEQIDGVLSGSNADSVRLEGCQVMPQEGRVGVNGVGDEFPINDNLKLDYGPFLDRFEETFLEGELSPMLLFETSRGCSWGEKVACSFCGLNGTAMRYRSMTSENALTQIRRLFDHSPRAHFFLAVDTVVPKEYLEEVFPKVEPPAGVAMMYEVRPDLSDSELAALIGAGVYVIQPGIEAMSTATLKLMRKGTTAFGNIRFLSRCRKFPIRVEWNLLIGSPGEEEVTYENYLRDLPLLFHLHPPGGVFPISFDRFSHYFEETEKWGLELEPHEYYEFAFPFESESLKKVAYHFVDRSSGRVKVDRWLDRLNTLVGEWWERWERRGRPDEAKLCWVRGGEGTSIYDSRSGSVRGYAVSEVAERMLNYLEIPRREGDVVGRFGEGQAGRELAFLREKGLIFEERGRVMGLVLD